MSAPLAYIRAPHRAAMVQKPFMAHVASRLYPVYLVNEFPKSGGTWLKDMLADSLGVPARTKGRNSWRALRAQGALAKAVWAPPRGGAVL